MFVGKYYHSLETKGRVLLPKPLRQNEKDWVVTRGLDGCLFVFTKHQFQSQLQPHANVSFTQKNNRDFLRLMVGEAVEVSIDNLGRINLPDHLITAGQLKKNLVVVGAINRIELWDLNLYHQYLAQLLPQAEQIAQAQSTYATPTSSID